MSEAVWSWYQPQPWRYGFMFTLQVTPSPQIWGQPGRCDGIREQPYALEIAYQWLKHSSYAYHGCMKRSKVDISLNHDVMASFLLHEWPWVLINSSDCMKRDNIHVVTEGIALGGEYDTIRMWLYGFTGKSIVSHQSVTSQSLVRNIEFWHYTP
jgi:hypothetical protein